MAHPEHDETGKSHPKVETAKFDALLFDLDGVVTQSMGLHSHAWKKLFDQFLKERAQKEGGKFEPFDIESDYRNYVDGKPRYDGVQSFLASRDISLEWGSPGDDPSRQTVCGLGNKKNRYFNQLIKEMGVEVYHATVEFIREARARGMKTAIVSSSKNCQPIIESVGIAELFDVRIDGIHIESLQLPGKPAPDMFLKASEQLGVDPARAVVFEDAISGVQAGRAGKFGLVVGVDRLGHSEDLLKNGADVVVSDLEELTLE